MSIKHPILDNLHAMKGLDPDGQLTWISQWTIIFTEAFNYASSIEIPSKLEIGEKKKHFYL